MVTKERLQELIDQKATIWHNDYGEITLNEDCEICKVTPVIVDVVIGYVLCGKSGEYNYELDIDELEEDIETAKWKCEMYTQRPEFFEPPTYEDFIKEPFITVDYEDGYKFLTKDGHFAYIRHNEYSDDTDEFEVGGNRVGYKSFTPTTKDNYIKACEYAQNLFLGKENENETDSDR